MSNHKTSVSDILDTLDDLADHDDAVTIGDVAEALGGRGFGPLILLPALIVISPLGGIPLLPTLMAIVIALFAVQVVLQREHLWLPDMLRSRAVADDRMKKAVARMRPVAGWMDQHMGSRLTILAGPPMETVGALVIILLCAVVPPSELVPFAALLPMSAIGALGLGLSLKDGVVMALGLVASILALWGIYTWVL
ncbi:Exopolysaccharide synthesis, ExoD [Sulfitobacter sp. THAF37]|uniref:exopolysaccharide biosynthesis protein n=1 Tax=Sulfitobacter sp. THAF37 TaxID=2587855 RepID=UPI0012681270|nr:exopolysaccharide biosynthesis protein [Sulfitobacter sp. THAF37]QFT58516.1 Exopolysaccharide synthesis, ExoD [Sulfitobacter sp. THAF37]